MENYLRVVPVFLLTMVWSHWWHCTPLSPHCPHSSPPHLQCTRHTAINVGLQKYLSLKGQLTSWLSSMSCLTSQHLVLVSQTTIYCRKMSDINTRDKQMFLLQNDTLHSIPSYHPNREILVTSNCTVTTTGQWELKQMGMLSKILLCHIVMMMLENYLMYHHLRSPQVTLVVQKHI